MRSAVKRSWALLTPPQQTSPRLSETVVPEQSEAKPQDMVPPDVWASIAEWSQYNKPSLRLLNKSQAAFGITGEQHLVITQANDLSRAVNTFSPGGILRLNASGAGLGDEHGPLLATLQIPHINLSRNPLSPESLQGLAANPHILSLNLNGCHLGDTGAAVLGRALASNTTLRHLNLANNDIGPEGAAALKHASSIETLNLSHNDIEAEGVARLFRAHQLSSLVELDLSHNNLIDPLNDPLDCIPTLTKLNVQSTFIGGEDLEQFFDSNPQINAFTLAGPELDMDRVTPRVLRGSNLEALTLINGNAFSGNLRHLGGIRSLRTLSLSNSTFSLTQLKAILAGNPRLEAIHLINDTPSTCHEAIALAHCGLLHPDVTTPELYRQNTRILSEHIHHFRELITDPALAQQPIGVRPDSLKTLVLQNSRIQEPGLRALLANRNIRHLDLRGGVHLGNPHLKNLLEAARNEPAPLPGQPERMRFDTLLF